MPPKFAGKNGKRGGGTPFNPSKNLRILADGTVKSQLPRSQMPPKFPGNHGRRSVAGGKIKQVWRPKQKPSSPPPWTELPRDITANILHRLGTIEMLENAERVCTTWRSVCQDPAMWRVIDMHNHGDVYDIQYNLEDMCRHAVDRSQGQCVGINLDYFASDELLDYIATRCGKLKRLQLACCVGLSDVGLSEAIKRLPELEELHIIRFFISNESVEMVGRSCLFLRSFAFNFNEFYDAIDDGYAMAIARSMPELRHLQLLKNGMTNKGVEAILDGCPHLESLDLRRCRYVKLTGDVGKRCSTQIKCLRYPNESTSDYEFHEDDDDSDFDEDDSESRSFDGYFDPDFLDYEDDINIDNYHLFYDDYSRPDHPDYLFDGDYFPFFG